jgi:hypothetical protein
MICSGIAQFIAFGNTGPKFGVFRNIRLPLLGLKDMSNAKAGDQFFNPKYKGQRKLTMDDAAIKQHTNTACVTLTH